MLKRKWLVRRFLAFSALELRRLSHIIVGVVHLREGDGFQEQIFQTDTAFSERATNA